MDIGAWLRDLGLDRYERAFRENEVGLDVLPKLTAEDLREIGVIPVGDRRRLLEAIAALAHDGEPMPSQAASADAEYRPGSAEAERRQLTVMFVDLVGSTALANKLDPEDLRDVIRAYQNACARVITRFEGHLAKFMGDGVLAYFGWPRAHEDDPERAVRAGLVVMQAISGMATSEGQPLAVRIGISTGTVVVGDLVGEGAAQEEEVVGETPHVAARLQSLAEPGQIMIAETTRRLLGNTFDLVDLGAKRVKGIAEPVGVFAVRGEGVAESRFEAYSGPSLLPMVGRDQELALLLERWALAKAGDGHGVLLAGEAGIGKSRIVRGLLDVVADEPHTRIRCQCSPYHIDSALWPVIQQLTRAAGIATADPIDTRLDKLEALLSRAGDTSNAAPLIASLMGLDGEDRYGPLDLTPQVQRARTLDELTRQILALAANQPVLVVLEDIHWVDPTTFALIEQCLDRIGDARVLILLTSRNDHHPELTAHHNITSLTLNRLGRSGVEAIVGRLSLAKGLAPEVVDAIVARADGVPLFVEELTKAILEIGETTIPASLQDSLMARLDRISGVKKVAQVAACIGRDFDFSLLAAIADLSEPELRVALERLESAGLVFHYGTPPDTIHTFKHALVQDAAYQSLLRATRRHYHAEIAQVFERQFPEVVETQPELLAHHFTEAGHAERALHYWQKAGRSAARRSANPEAIGHLTRGLDVLSRLPHTPERTQRELDFQMILGPVFMAMKGHGAPEVERTYSRARALCHQIGETPLLSRVLAGLCAYHTARGPFTTAYELAEQLLPLAQRQNEARLFLTARTNLGVTAFLLGKFALAHEHLEQGLVLSKSEPRRGNPAQDLGVTCCSYAGLTLFSLGYPDQALTRSQMAVKLARELNQPFSLAYALYFASFLHKYRREPEAAQACAEEGIALSSEQDFALWWGGAKLHRGWALAELNNVEEGLGEMRQGMDAWFATGAEVAKPHYLALFADIEQRVGKCAEGLRKLDEALGVTEQLGERFYEAELHRLKGELMLQHCEAKTSSEIEREAEASFQRAFEIACHQRAKSWELRAAMSLARLWRAQDRITKARAILGGTYDWFTEGLETRDLSEARALLQTLR